MAVQEEPDQVSASAVPAVEPTATQDAADRQETPVNETSAAGGVAASNTKFHDAPFQTSAMAPAEEDPTAIHQVGAHDTLCNALLVAPSGIGVF
jgi:hypothetical protein